MLDEIEHHASSTRTVASNVDLGGASVLIEIKSLSADF